MLRDSLDLIIYILYSSLTGVLVLLMGRINLAVVHTSGAYQCQLQIA